MIDRSMSTSYDPAGRGYGALGVFWAAADVTNAALMTSDRQYGIIVQYPLFQVVTTRIRQQASDNLPRVGVATPPRLTLPRAARHSSTLFVPPNAMSH
jgi:hypothetical protein